MTDMVTLIAKTTPLERELNITSRTVQPTDLPRLGELYFTAYDAGVAGDSLEVAIADMQASLEGKYGPFLPEASHVALDESGKIVAAVLVVERAVGDDTPEAPFIIELITDREHRRRGLAEDLVLATLDTLFNEGQKDVALRVEASNSAALALYLSLDFHRWSPESAED
ncbi:ribosomal protein S18 acetylase RimI-like enzyme [Arthrobacter stackebrandtii]|uniref:Ribosomal protein S18 acetylase RimI-like enzyme n=1 Tax=Arthrobacter stackebrandtii TaxID=272161 RepID=A0ABS4Z020_9MICC|nr:GNAT family N-acetyltransferase [Arthrobacter stackebrandtii]MBP2414349.1 ribosomal protein S18 acetylase RimI-like enzyme [Arthrobacter stackebrandtii]PYH01492.1 GNAT family N-acetyltransferase [Arthrobacter stackebrandtii]